MGIALPARCFADGKQTQEVSIMFFRAFLVVVVTFCGISAVSAQNEDAIKQRDELMRIQGRHGYGTLPRMVRGQDPYDQGKVDAAFADFTSTSQKLPGLWPDNSKPTGPSGDFNSSLKIWENKADFDARLAKFTKDVADHRGKVSDLDGLKASFAVIRQNCDSCHEQYRVKN
jgi:cytochrome c556